jgi:hypothetical protein
VIADPEAWFAQKRLRELALYPRTLFSRRIPYISKIPHPR